MCQRNYAFFEEHKILASDEFHKELSKGFLTVSSSREVCGQTFWQADYLTHGRAGQSQSWYDKSAVDPRLTPKFGQLWGSLFPSAWCCHG